jgi:hypothetical protein
MKNVGIGLLSDPLINKEKTAPINPHSLLIEECIYYLKLFFIEYKCSLRNRGELNEL